MDIVVTIIAGLFIALLLAFAFTFGMTLIAIILATAAVAAMLAIVRERLRRWRFIRDAEPEADAGRGPTVIEGDYKDITTNH